MLHLRRFLHALHAIIVKNHDGQCAYHDDMGEIMQKLIGADVIVMDRTVYVYSISTQLKTVINRF